MKKPIAFVVFLLASWIPVAAEGSQGAGGGAATTPKHYGPEMLTRTNFNDGTVPDNKRDNKRWKLWQGKTTLKLSNVEGILRLEMNRRNGDLIFLPVLFFHECPVEEGKRYALSYEIRAETPSKFKVAVKRPSHETIGLDVEATADPEWKIWTHEFTATGTEKEPVWFGFPILKRNTFTNGDVFPSVPFSAP